MTRSKSLTYIITRNRRIEGVNLSLRGEWGNRPYPDAETAERAARENANGQPFTVERESF